MAAPKTPLANECSNRMKSELPEYFTGVVAHGSHSLTQQDVQFYFPNEKEEITFPVVNPNLQSETEILSKPVEIALVLFFLKQTLKSPVIMVALIGSIMFSKASAVSLIL